MVSVTEAYRRSSKADMQIRGIFGQAFRTRCSFGWHQFVQTKPHMRHTEDVVRTADWSFQKFPGEILSSFVGSTQGVQEKPSYC